MALMLLVPTEPAYGLAGKDRGRNGGGRGRESDDELAVATEP